jgi:hypothetical protein
MEEFNTVEINAEEYYDLLDRDAWLSALEAAGVDSWEGIDTAREIYEADNE